MKQKMTLQEVQDYYKTSSIIQTDEGFEFPDEARGFALVIPHDFYRFFDGGLIDPVMMLVDRMGWMRQELFRNPELELCTPVLLRYAFGKAVVTDGKTKFYMQDPMEPVDGVMDVLVEAEWDLRQGVSNEGWIPEVERYWRGQILHKKTLPVDTYETRGKQIWILRATKAAMEIVSLKNNFYTWQKQMITRSDEMLQKFETEKENYRKQIVECLRKLPGRVHWIIVDAESDWSQDNTNLELWVRNEYDFQVIQSEDCLEIKSRGGSPGVITMECARYDALGLQICHSLMSDLERMI